MRRRELLKWAVAGCVGGADAQRLFAAGRMQANPQSGSDGLPFDRMAGHIVRALRPSSGERAILRHDPTLLPELLSKARKQLEATGARVESLPYGAAEGFEQRLAEADIYVWLPASPGPSGATPGDQAAALVRWLDSGRGRQIHFHWGDGTRNEDGGSGRHTAEFDRVYAEALEIDYAALDRQMDSVITKLRSGEVRVETRAGTDLRFQVGDRPFCKQNGDASLERVKAARVRIDREIELPAGALRVAPLEESVKGRIVIPRANLGGADARDIELRFDKGQIKSFDAAGNSEAVRRTLSSNPALRHFREFALGMNPKLMKPAGSSWIPYYGYGAGVVRLSLGDNEELGGKVRGGAVRWFFFPDATVSVGSQIISQRGTLRQA